MRTTSRIPALRDTSFDGMLVWFAKLAKKPLAFGWIPDD